MLDAGALFRRRWTLSLSSLSLARAFSFFDRLAGLREGSGEEPFAYVIQGEPTLLRGKRREREPWKFFFLSSGERGGKKKKSNAPVLDADVKIQSLPASAID